MMINPIVSMRVKKPLIAALACGMLLLCTAAFAQKQPKVMRKLTSDICDCLTQQLNEGSKEAMDGLLVNCLEGLRGRYDARLVELYGADYMNADGGKDLGYDIGLLIAKNCPAFIDLIKVANEQSAAIATSQYEAAEQLFAEGKFAEAIPFYDEAIENEPENAEFYVDRGATYSRLGDYYRAISDYLRAIDFEPGYLDAWCYMGYGKYKLGDYEGAYEDLQTAYTIDSTYFLVYHYRGLANFGLDAYGNASEDFKHAWQINPEFLTALSSLAYTQMELGNYEQAIGYYNAYLAKDEAGVEEWVYRAQCHYRLNNYDSALWGYDHAITLMPKNLNLHYWKTRVLFDMGKNALVVSGGEWLLEKEPENSSFLNLKGMAQQGLEDYEAAEASFHAAIASDSTESAYWQNLGNLYLEVGQFGEAVTSLNTALSLEPDDLYLLTRRAIAYQKQGKSSQALNELNRVLVIDDGWADAYDARGRLYVKQRKYSLAVADFTKSIELFATDPAIYHERGLAYARLGKTQQACADLAKAVEMAYAPAKADAARYCK